MAYLLKYKKSILVDLAYELGLDPNPNLRIPDLKKLIVNDTGYDEVDTKSIVEALWVQAQKQEEFELEEKKKQAEFEKEEKKRQAEFEREEKKRQAEFEREEKKRQEDREDQKRQEEREYDLEVRRLEKERLRRKRQVEFEERKREIEREYEEWKELFKWEPVKLKLACARERQLLKKLEEEKAQGGQQSDLYDGLSLSKSLSNDDSSCSTDFSDADENGNPKIQNNADRYSIYDSINSNPQVNSEVKDKNTDMENKEISQTSKMTNLKPNNYQAIETNNLINTDKIKPERPSSITNVPKVDMLYSSKNDTFKTAKHKAGRDPLIESTHQIVSRKYSKSCVSLPSSLRKEIKAKSEENIVPSTKGKLVDTPSKIINNVLCKVVVSDKQVQNSRRKISRKKGYVKSANKMLVKKIVSEKPLKSSRKKGFKRKSHVTLANKGLGKSMASHEKVKVYRQKLSVRKGYDKRVTKKNSFTKFKVSFLQKEEIVLFRDTELSWHYKVNRQKYKRIFILVICKNGGHSAYKLM